MSKKFDPMKDREFFKNDLLPTMPAFAPDEGAASSVPVYIKAHLGSLTRFYWLGLTDEARPKLVEVLRWMEKRQPPHLHNWPEGQAHYRAGPTAHFMWWQSLGVIQWLLDNDAATEAFSRAVRVEWDGWESATPAQVVQDRAARQDHLGERLATCLTANEPAYGIRFYDGARLRAPLNKGRPAVEFGRWACASLRQGGSRDATFVAKGTEMLRATLLSFFEPSSFWWEATLWLKVIYFDSGVTRTAEETIFRAYDLMPGVPRPDFVPSPSKM